VSDRDTAAVSPRVPVGRFRPMCAVLLPIIVQCVHNGGGRWGVRSVRQVGDDAWGEYCRSDRPTRASMEKHMLNCTID